MQHGVDHASSTSLFSERTQDTDTDEPWQWKLVFLGRHASRILYAVKKKHHTPSLESPTEKTKLTAEFPTVATEV